MLEQRWQHRRHHRRHARSQSRHRPRNETDRGQRPPLFSRRAARSSASRKERAPPIELLVENTDYYKTYKIDYHGGEKYPHLVRDNSKPDLLTEILKAK